VLEAPRPRRPPPPPPPGRGGAKIWGGGFNNGMLQKCWDSVFPREEGGSDCQALVVLLPVTELQPGMPLLPGFPEGLQVQGPSSYVQELDASPLLLLSEQRPWPPPHGHMASACGPGWGSPCFTVLIDFPPTAGPSS
jgi:hypothetical protein